MNECDWIGDHWRGLSEVKSRDFFFLSVLKGWRLTRWQFF